MGKCKLRIIFRLSVILLTLTFASVFFTGTVNANTISELKSKQEDIKDERAEIKKDLSQAEAEIADILLDLKELNQEIQDLENALKQNQAMLDETEEEIKNLVEEIQALEEEINELEIAIEKRNDILKQRIKSYQKNGGNIGFLQVLFGANSFTEFISRVSAVTKITNSDQDLIKKQEEDKAQVEDVKLTVQNKLEEQNDMKTELKGMEEVILEQKKQAEQSKKTLQEKEKELQEKKSKLESKDSRLSALEAQVRRDIASAQNTAQRVSTSTPSSSGGDLGTLANNVSGDISVAINAGKQYIGKTRYVWASSNPANGGFDCSGFVSWAFGQAGYSLPSSTAGLSRVGQKVDYKDIQPGDLVFFNTYKTNGHVGIYLGNGKFIGSQSSTGVDIASMSNSYWNQRFTGHVRRIR